MGSGLVAVIEQNVGKNFIAGLEKILNHSNAKRVRATPGVHR